MGSGFRTFAASEVLTSSNVQNYLMDQAVTVHSGTAVLATAIPSPEPGMVAYVNSGDASEGLYVHTGSAWLKGPGWNAPWGVVGYGTSTADTTISTSTQTSIGLATGAMTLLANRLYEVNWSAAILASGAALQTLTFELWNASAKVVGLQSVSVSSTAYYAVGGVAYVTVSASSPTWTVRCLAGGGGGSVSNKGTVTPSWLTVRDIGPTGAPA